MADYDPAFTDLEAQVLIGETENEIFRDALDKDHPDDVMGDELIYDQSRVEDWHGHVDEDELWQTTRFGHMQDGFSRPLAHREEMEAAAQNEQLRQQLAERDQQILELLDQTGPVKAAREQAQQQRREALLEAAVDPARADQVLGALEGQQAQIHSQNMDRANAALEAAHARYGRDFERVYQAAAAMDRRNPLSNQLLYSILNAADPGEALMQLHGNPLLGMLSSGAPPPPFMPGPRGASRAQSRSSQVGHDDLADNDGGIDARMEQDIWGAALR